MSKHVILLSIPALREKDLEYVPVLKKMAAEGAKVALRPGFPAVTCTVQANMTTGRSPREHGIIANGQFDRESGKVEMWTAPNTAIEAPQLWEVLAEEAKARSEEFTSACWFPMHCKQTQADYACTPAPIHNPDGSESLWCYTKPTELYGELRDELGHFPLQHFWGPMTNVAGSKWIVDSAVIAAKRWRPNLFYIYLPHLDYEPQRHGPDSEQVIKALKELNDLLADLVAGMDDAYGEEADWCVAGEYAITPVDTVVHPNRILREAEMLSLVEQDGAELLQPGESKAWALADHQVAHVFVRDEADLEQVAALFENVDGVAEVLVGPDISKYGLEHESSGEIVLVSEPNAWFAYYWWTDSAKAPPFATKVDIHRKPGYDPVELFWDRTANGVPLDAGLVKGSHGAPVTSPEQETVAISNRPDMFHEAETLDDADLFEAVRRRFCQ